MKRSTFMRSTLSVASLILGRMEGMDCHMQVILCRADLGSKMRMGRERVMFPLPDKTCAPKSRSTSIKTPFCRRMSSGSSNKRPPSLGLDHPSMNCILGSSCGSGLKLEGEKRRKRGNKHGCAFPWLPLRTFFPSSYLGLVYQ